MKGSGGQKTQWGPQAELWWESGDETPRSWKHRLYRNTINNTEHNNTEINTMKTSLGKNYL